MQKKTVYPEWVQQYRTKGTTVKNSNWPRHQSRQKSIAFPKQYGIESLSTVSRILGNIHETTLNTFMISLA